MRYSTVPAINLEAHIQRNRELISKLPQRSYQPVGVWHDGRWIQNPELAPSV